MDTTFRRLHILPCTLLFLTFLLSGLLLPSSAMTGESCTQLLADRCEACHYLTRVCQKVDRERSKKYWFGSPEGVWKRTINNMVKQGAQLNEAEEKILIECLSSPTPELKNLCKLDK